MAQTNCSPDPNSADKCEHVLSPLWKSWHADQLLDALDEISWNKSSSPGVNRTGKKCGSDLPSQVIRSPQDAMFVDESVPLIDGTAFAMAKFVPQGRDPCAETRYGAGGHGGNRLNHAYYLIFIVDSKYGKPPAYGTVIGRWKLLAFDWEGSEVKMDSLSGGPFVRCTTKHDPHIRSWADFQTCAKQDTLAEFAHSQKWTIDSTLRTFISVRTAVQRRAAGLMGDSTAALEKALGHRVFGDLQKLLGDPDDPAWMSCGLGCCLADRGDSTRTPPPGRGRGGRNGLSTLLPLRGKPLVGGVAALPKFNPFSGS